MRRRALVLLLLTAATVVARGPSAWACSCDPAVSKHEPATVRNEVKASHAVFTGMAAVVVSEDETSNVTFAVRDVFKGTVAESYVVANQPLPPAGCGIDFVEGKLYDVFVTLEKKVPSTQLCAGTDVTGHVKRAGVPVKYSYDLEGNTIGDATDVDGARDRGARTGVITAAALLLALIGAYYVARARARRRTGRRTGLPR